jgi:hypothetical protein
VRRTKISGKGAERCGICWWSTLVRGKEKGGMKILTLAFEEVPIDFILDFRDNIRVAIEAKNAVIELRS